MHTLTQSRQVLFFFCPVIPEISGCKSGIEPILQRRLAPSVGRASLRALFLFFRDFPVSAVDRQLFSPCSLCSGLCALCVASLSVLFALSLSLAVGCRLFAVICSSLCPLFSCLCFVCVGSLFSFSFSFSVI